MNPAIGYLPLPFLTIRSRRGFPSRVAIVPGSVAETSLNFWKERLIKLKQGARQAHAERGEANGRRHRSPRASDCASYNDSKEECYEATREAAMAAFGKSWRRG